MKDNALSKIGAAYIRVSDERQDEYSPASQLKKIREYAAKDGYYIPDEYVFYDDGISGRSVKKRDDFNRMIAIAKEKNHPFDIIYVWKFSRFARNQEESLVYKNLLKKKCVAVVSVSQAIPDGQFGSLIERIIEWMDEFYSINLSEEVKRGMTEKASRGEPVCPPPFGYVMKDGKYIPDEESGNANIVREVFRLYADGVKLREIAVLLGKNGVRTKYGNVPDNRWIEYMLCNPCYVGKLRWSVDGVRAVSKRDFDSDKIMLIDALHEPLISTELWDKVQTILETQKQTYAKYSRKSQPVEYMLKGLVRCSACGATLISGSITGKANVRNLQCHNYARGACHTSHGITLPRLEAAVKEGLRNAIKDKQFNIVPARTAKPTDIVDYDKLIEAEQRRLNRAKEAYLAEIDTIDQYAYNKEHITKRIAELEAKKAEQAETQYDLPSFEQKVSSVLEFIERPDVTDSAKNEALRSIIQKIVFEKPKGNVAIFFHDL